MTDTRSSHDKGALRVCLIASVPSTIKVFYQPLIAGLRRAGAEVTMIASGGPELDALAQTFGVSTHAVTITRRISPLSDLIAIRRLCRYFRAHRFDLIHAHTPKAGLVGMVAGRLARVPARVYTLHGLPLETATGLKRRIMKAAERLTCRLAHRVCVVSPSLRDRAKILRLCRADKMTILGEGTACGVDLSRFERTDDVVERAGLIRSEHHIPDNAIVVGFVGWLVADKGVPGLVKVFSRLAERRDDLYLLMIGADGSDRDPVPRETLVTIKEHPRICHGGLVPDPVTYYAAMDFCVLPTRREGFPYVVLEAAALGVPTVATRVTGCVDAIVDGETGILIEPESMEALAGAIDRLAGDVVLRKSLGDAAAQRVRASFGSDRLVDEHLRLYEELTSWHDAGASRTIA